MTLKALFLNCTLKKSPETSNTEAYIDVARGIFSQLDVETQSIRMADYTIAFGNSSNEGGQDQWPEILEKIKAHDMLIIASPVWRGDRSSISKLVAERMDGIWEETNENNGQYPTYNKVAGVMVDGNEDGAKKGIANILLDLSEQGFSLGVNPFSYYVGEAGPGPSYIQNKGDQHLFTNKMLYFMIHNMVHLTRVLKENPYTSNLNELTKKAEAISDTSS